MTDGSHRTHPQPATQVTECTDPHASNTNDELQVSIIIPDFGLVMHFFNIINVPMHLIFSQDVDPNVASHLAMLLCAKLRDSDHGVHGQP